jgi:hypothetical protein
VTSRSHEVSGSPVPGAPDLGDIVVLLLAGSLVGLRDRLAEDGYEYAAELVADLIDIVDDYVTRLS